MILSSGINFCLFTDYDGASNDNRNLQDAGSGNQKLSSDDIIEMRKDGLSGQVKIDNRSNFHLSSSPF